VKFTGVATVLVLSSCVSAGFYLYLVTLMFMKERPAGENVGGTGGMTRFVILATAVAIIVLGVFSTPVVRWAERGSAMSGGMQQVLRDTTVK
jgi:NADH-quinone oxidoreductase subunit N